ncbi:centromere protein H (CENP-H)-domain-containing protein [Xylariales sp. PMI_506]|nr:centromere protein H (CENP-H)-domain-containing protein [Xylariales sp. PMI_506]
MSTPNGTQGEGEKTNPLHLSDDEKRILELYDRLQQLRLEVSLITAQKEYTSDQTTSTSIEQAQNELLEARAKYILRNDVVESVLMANPVLQAVHGGTNASPIEKYVTGNKLPPFRAEIPNGDLQFRNYRDLFPVLAQRDGTSITLAQQSTSMRQDLDELANVESQSIRLARQNVGLASELLSLAEETKQHKAESINDPEQVAEIARLEQDVQASRQRWRVMKATSSAIVAGSGVDWAKDDILRGIVLDDDDDGF